MPAWSATEKVLLLRAVFDTAIIQLELARQHELHLLPGTGPHFPMQKYLEKVGKKYLNSPGYEGLSLEEVHCEHMASVLLRALKPDTSLPAGSEDHDELLPTIDLSGKVTNEKRWKSTATEISPREIVERLKDVPMQLIDWEKVHDLWSDTAGCQNRSLSSLRTMFSKLRKGKGLK